MYFRSKWYFWLVLSMLLSMCKVNICQFWPPRGLRFYFFISNRTLVETSPTNSLSAGQFKSWLSYDFVKLWIFPTEMAMNISVHVRYHMIDHEYLCSWPLSYDFVWFCVILNFMFWSCHEYLCACPLSYDFVKFWFFPLKWPWIFLWMFTIIWFCEVMAIIIWFC